MRGLSAGGKSALFAIALLGGACSLLTDVDGLTGDPAKGGGDRDGAVDATSGQDATADVGPPFDAGDASPDGDAGPSIDAGRDADAGPCPAGVGPSMIQAMTLLGVHFCIDSTEVTQAQYEAFLLAKGSDTSGQGPLCDFNTSYLPTDCGSGPFDPVGKADMPVVCVDWCDARAFCAWNGKRLCGRIDGGADDPSTLTNASVSQWYAACSRNGALAYPYGDAYDAGACNTSEAGSPPAMWAVASHPACQGGLSGLFDMSGNVGEWEDGCVETDAGAMFATCPFRGDTFNAAGGSPYLRCDNGGQGYQFGERYTLSVEIGFRCCSP